MSNGVKSPFVNKNGSVEEQIVTDKGYGRFNSQEIALLRLFKEKSLVTCLVKILQQSELSEVEVSLATSTFKGNQELYRAISKALKPEADESGLVAGTRWVDRKYSDISLSDVKSILLARKDSIKFVDLGLDRLKNIVERGDVATLEKVVDMGMEKDYENETPENIKRSAVAFQDTMIFLANHVGMIEQLANMREETPQEREEREKKNSTK